MSFQKMYILETFKTTCHNIGNKCFLKISVVTLIKVVCLFNAFIVCYPGHWGFISAESF